MLSNYKDVSESVEFCRIVLYNAHAQHLTLKCQGIKQKNKSKTKQTNKQQ